MADFVIANPMHGQPERVVVIDQATIDHRDRLLERAHGWIGKITTDEDHSEANCAVADLHAFQQQIEKARKKLTEPALEYQRALMAAATEAVVGIEELKRKLGGDIAAWDAKRKAERAAAEAEARRQEDEARRLAEEQALMDLPPGEDAPVFSAPVHVAAVPVAVAPPPKSAVVAKQITRAVVDDEAKLPLSVNGQRLWKEPDLKTIELLLKAGVNVPGARLITETRVDMKGRR